MGNDNNQPTNNKHKHQDYTFLKYHTKGKLMRHTTTHKIAVVVERTFACEQLLQQYVKQLQKKEYLNHQFYVNAYDHEILSLTNLCSKQFKVVEYFQHHPHTLLQEITIRAATGKHFTQKEVMSILCSCVLAMSHLSKKDVLHYTLNPNDIVIDEEGVCKVLSSEISENQFDFNYKHGFYYAPQTLKIFRMQTAPNGLTNKCGVFTLGMTLLQMLFLIPPIDFYNTFELCIEMQSLNECLGKVNSLALRQILTKMLKYHSYDRITFTQLEEMLFEVIRRSESSGQSSHARIQDYAQQSQKLEESIVRIQNQRDSCDEKPSFPRIEEKPMYIPIQIDSADDIRSLTKTECRVRYQPSKPLPNDEEDQANRHQLDAQKDQIVLDQSDGNQKRQDSYSGQRSLQNCYSEASLNKLSNYSSINPRVLTEHSNFSNLKDYHPNFLSKRHLDEDYFQQKENCIPNYSLKTDLILEDQSYPRYVTEESQEGRYEGYKVGKFRQGFGTFYYKDGGKYCGEWLKNRMEGKGVLYYSSGKIAYEGEWKDDNLHGYGVLYNENIIQINQGFDFSHLEELDDQWIKYEGYFENDVKGGQGTLFLSNGESYRGVFENDQPNGQGQYRNVRGEIVRGFWLMGALNSVS